MHTALDATDCRSLAEFYRQFLGLRYRPGDETSTDGSDDDSDWLVLLDPTGIACSLSSRSRLSPDRPGPYTMYRSRCITTSACPTCRNCGVNGSAPNHSGPLCCTTALTTTATVVRAG